MKNFKRIFSWICLSLVIQFAGLFYIDKYYLAVDTGVKVKKIENKNKQPDIEVAIPSNATHTGVSFDGKYAAYYQEDVLKVVNTKTGKIKDISFDDGVKVSYYKWISDRNRMLIAEKHSTEDGYGFKLSYYDVDKDSKEEIKDLTWGDQVSEVEDIQASTLTNVIYVNVSRGEEKNNLYWINIMKEMKKVPIQAYSVGHTAILNHEDKLLYEDANSNKIFGTNMDESVEITGVKNPCLLGVDTEDNVYIGAMENNKMTKIYYGNLEEATSQWTQMALKEPASKEDIFILNEGKILVNDSIKGVIKDIGTGKETVYKGKILQIFSTGIASILDGKLVKTNFN
ncbi:hypothetical protein [Clostridium rectalis]|uniref:hypothetical protein n=1 Tax=Clostridium rectalis TaxID=2040295 RepID=UPI000F62DC5E|nr:hypothetical protein [Clostridium rectalis]